MKPAIQTARLTFRDFTVDDFEAVHEYASDPVVTRYTAFGPNTVEQTKGFLQLVSGESSQEDPRKLRQGLASEATAALIKFGFGELRAHRLWAHVFPGNTASERVLQKLGFRYEGCALKSFFVRDAWHDLQTFAMLSSEWAKRVG